MNEASWRKLIAKIRENNVVPIIGPRLLVGADGQAPLQEQVAKRLLQDLGMEVGDVPLPPFRELNEAVSRLKANPEIRLQDLYDGVHDAIRAITAAGAFSIPAPISQLAQIADFRLLVTLTPDRLLASSLGERCKVNEIVHSPNLPTSECKDLCRDWQGRAGEVYLLYLFGRSQYSPTFAIHDEDVLEYTHNVMANGSQVLSGVLRELQQRNLLLIGCNFPDWLSRFFLRATNQKRLSEQDKRAWLIEPLRPEESLTCFLRSYSRFIEILSEASPVEFVAELHQRWMAECGAGARADPPPDERVPRGAMFFISYSRETDLRRAESLYQALLRQGVTAGEVWFDRQTIEPGQNFRDRIVDGIHSCRYFLPLLSEAAGNRSEAFVFVEWNQANDRKKAMNREFVLPVIVDPVYDPKRYITKKVVPAVREWGELDFGHAPEGVPDARLEAKLKELLRDARRAQ